MSKTSPYMPMNRAYKDAVRDGQRIYTQQPVTTYIWTTSKGGRFATGNRPTGPDVKILAEIKSDGR